ncbi:MAG: NAD(P)-dependent oxidoreductase [Lachnospiraceae bacterium]|jgi:nucleoside-diphosphate-sugar epimerase|nr:NAD(P)-dependent oxidoreductase [Lachnospiraceae bacterium]MEE3460944.1 NAD(P)-dependent oxidoreductase [Lachnospiraceae bacterium]
MRVLVTGAAGYIGRHVVKAFLNEGHEVIASDFQFKGVDERAKFIEVPIFSGRDDIFEKLGKPDVLVHLAWRDGFIHNSAAHMLDLSSHVKFLENMIDGGLKYLTVMGTMHEVGYWEGPIEADTPCNPMSMYGIAKNALRQTLLLYCKDKDVNLHWLRAYYIYGDDIHGSSIFAKLCQAEEDGKAEFPFTSGKNRYDFIHIDELARQITAASVQNKINGVINVCKGQTMTLAEKVESYIKDHNFKIHLKYGAYPDRPYDSPGEWGDAELIKKIMEDHDAVQ